MNIYRFEATIKLAKPLSGKYLDELFHQGFHRTHTIGGNYGDVVDIEISLDHRDGMNDEFDMDAAYKTSYPIENISDRIERTLQEDFHSKLPITDIQIKNVKFVSANESKKPIRKSTMRTDQFLLDILTEAAMPRKIYEANRESDNEAELEDAEASEKELEAEKKQKPKVEETKPESSITIREYTYPRNLLFQFFTNKLSMTQTGAKNILEALDSIVELSLDDHGVQPSKKRLLLSQIKTAIGRGSETEKSGSETIPVKEVDENKQEKAYRHYDHYNDYKNEARQPYKLPSPIPAKKGQYDVFYSEYITDKCNIKTDAGWDGAVRILSKRLKEYLKSIDKRFEDLSDSELGKAARIKLTQSEIKQLREVEYKLSDADLKKIEETK